MASAIGLMTGPLLGGWLSEAFSWRAIFFLNAPIALFVIVITATRFSSPNYGQSTDLSLKFDWLGFVLLCSALGALVTALMQSPLWGWTSLESLIFFALSFLAIIGFAYVEQKAPNPVLEVDLFRNPTFTAANTTTFFAQFAKTSVIVYCPYYMIEILRLSPFEAGNGLLPGIVMAIFVAPWTGAIVDRRGARTPVLIALSVLALSMFYLSYVIVFKSYTMMIPGLIGWGYGATAMFAGSRRAVQSSVPGSKAGQASGINSTAQWLGAALGVPIFGLFVRNAPHFGLLYLAAGLIVTFATFMVWRSFHPPVPE